MPAIGGSGEKIDFVDLDLSKKENIEFSSDAPKWSIATNGTNIEGICNNSKCEAFNE